MDLTLSCFACTGGKLGGRDAPDLEVKVIVGILEFHLLVEMKKLMEREWK